MFIPSLDTISNMSGAIAILPIAYSEAEGSVPTSKIVSTKTNIIQQWSVFKDCSNGHFLVCPSNIKPTISRGPSAHLVVSPIGCEIHCVFQWPTIQLATSHNALPPISLWPVISCLFRPPQSPPNPPYDLVVSHSRLFRRVHPLLAQIYLSVIYFILLSSLYPTPLKSPIFEPLLFSVSHIKKFDIHSTPNLLPSSRSCIIRSWI